MASPVRWVVFPRYVPNAVPTLRPIPRSQAMYDLAKQCFTIRVDQKRTLQCLAPIVRGAEGAISILERSALDTLVVEKRIYDSA